MSFRVSESQQSGAAAAGRATLKKAVTPGDREPIEKPKPFPFPVCSFLSGHLMISHMSRAYSYALIVCSQAMDPQRTTSMVKKEEKAWQHFEELKAILLKRSPHWWKNQFKSYVDTFIEACINSKELICSLPCQDEEEEEYDHINLHGLRRLVAGAAQEWELAQQPEHAAICAKLDGALVWQGRGYVRPILHAI